MELEFPYDCAENFLKFFDLINEDGDMAIGILNFKKGQEKEVIKEFDETLTNFGCGIFALTLNNDELTKKMNHEFQEVKGGHIWFCNFASFLGLPGEDPILELREFKNFLLFLKETSLKHCDKRINLQVYKWFDESGLNILVQDNDDLKVELNEEMNKRINASPVLSAWKNNQVKTISQIHPHLETLWNNFLTLKLMDDDEKKICLDAQENKPKIKSEATKKQLRKVKRW